MVEPSEAELFALALSWGDKLRGRASLQVPTHAGRLHPRDEQWLTLELQKLARRSVRLETPATIRAFVADAREAVGVWRAIACCAGFTARENPVFWRRVVSHTYRCTHLRQHGCSDEFTFFASCEFPRLRLYFEDRLAYETTDQRALEEARHVDAVCREFFGLNDEVNGYEPSGEYIAALAALEPFISHTRYAQPIPVAIDLPSWDTSHLYPVVERLLTDLRSASAGRTGRFEIEELSLDDMRVLFHDDAFVSYQPWLQLPNIKMTHWWWKTQSMDIDAAVPPSAILTATGMNRGLGPGTGSLQTLLVNRHTLTDQRFRGLCAALPLARSLRHVRFSELSRRHDWAWLATALFHPKAASSSWRELSVDMCHLDAQDLDAVRAVRDEGIQSLPAVVDMAPGQGDQPLTVVLKGPSKIHWGDGSFMRTSETAQFDGFGRLDAARVGVIVPAHGVGYVDSDEVVECSIRTPGSSSHVTHFRATVMTSTPSELRDWLALIGSTSLQLIEVIDHSPLPVAATAAILASCPALTSLNVTQDGSIWTTAIPRQPMLTWPNLRTLNITSSSPAQAVAVVSVLGSGRAGPLPGLRQLRLEIAASDKAAGYDEPTLQRVSLAVADLVRRVRTITHLTLHGVTPARGRGEIQTLTYDQYRDNVMATLGVDTSVFDTSSDARIALLSVLQNETKHFPSLSTDLLRIVFAFAGREIRNAWIEL